MIRLSDNQTELLPALHRGDMPRFNARQSAMIRQYERIRTEWEQQLDLLECPERKNHSQLLAKAEWLDRQLAMMEWKLPDTYTCPIDAIPPSGPTTIAAAFTHLLNCHSRPAEVRTPGIHSTCLRPALG